LQEEVDGGLLITTPHKPTIVNAIGAVPKEGSDELRLITDASRPRGASLNSYMTVNSFSFDTVDTALDMVGKDYYQCKIDLRHGYRSVPIHPDDYQHCGAKWSFNGSAKPTYIMDTRLCFGASKAPEIFQKITSSVVRMMKRRGYTSCFVYLDDFYICSPSQEGARAAYDCLWKLLTDLGFTINRTKSVPPTKQLVFLGLMIDTANQIVSIPERKLQDLRQELSSWQCKKRATKRELQRLLGKLNWAARVVRSTRPFLRRLINLVHTVDRPCHHIRLSAAAKTDITWLRDFSMKFNGVAYWISSRPLPDHAMATDATSSATAAVHAGDYVYSDFRADNTELLPLPIHVKELHGVLIGLRRWHPAWKNKKVYVFTDNTVAMAAINKGTTRCMYSMPILREIYSILALNNIYLLAKRVDTKSNALADALSRMSHPPFYIKASQLLREWGIPCCPYSVCDPLQHMTLDSLFYLLQSWRGRNAI